MQLQSRLLAHKANCDLAEYNLLDYKWCIACKCSSGMPHVSDKFALVKCVELVQRCARQTAWEGQDLSRSHLAHHELESVCIIIVTINIIVTITITITITLTIGVGVQVIDPQSWNMIFDRMRALPPTTRHVVMVTTVPVVYPQVRSNTAEMTLLG